MCVSRTLRVFIGLPSKIEEKIPYLTIWVAFCLLCATESVATESVATLKRKEGKKKEIRFSGTPHWGVGGESAVQNSSQQSENPTRVL